MRAGARSASGRARGSSRITISTRSCGVSRRSIAKSQTALWRVDDERRRRLLRRVLSAVAPHAQIGLFLVAPEALDRAEPAAIFADHHARLGRSHLLIGAGLQELADPQPAGVAGRALGRQRVVGADHLVAIGDIGVRPEEESAVILEAVEIAARRRG